MLTVQSYFLLFYNYLLTGGNINGKLIRIRPEWKPHFKIKFYVPSTCRQHHLPPRGYCIIWKWCNEGGNENLSKAVKVFWKIRNYFIKHKLREKPKILKGRNSDAEACMYLVRFPNCNETSKSKWVGEPLTSIACSTINMIVMQYSVIRV